MSDCREHDWTRWVSVPAIIPTWQQRECQTCGRIEQDLIRNYPVAAGQSGSPRTMSAQPISMQGSLPSGPEFAISITKQVIALRAGDLICAAHPRWMNAEQALQLADQLKDVARDR